MIPIFVARSASPFIKQQFSSRIPSSPSSHHVCRPPDTKSTLERLLSSLCRYHQRWPSSHSWSFSFSHLFFSIESQTTFFAISWPHKKKCMRKTFSRISQHWTMSPQNRTEEMRGICRHFGLLSECQANFELDLNTSRRKTKFPRDCEMRAHCNSVGLKFGNQNVRFNWSQLEFIIQACGVEVWCVIEDV